MGLDNSIVVDAKLCCGQRPSSQIPWLMDYVVHWGDISEALASRSVILSKDQFQDGVNVRWLGFGSLGVVRLNDLRLRRTWSHHT